MEAFPIYPTQASKAFSTGTFYHSVSYNYIFIDESTNV